jgi:glycosyltransferase involved in cell wall biosynthesis
MRLLFITRKYPPSVGGMETWSKEIDAAFRAAGQDVDLHKPATDHIGRPSLLQMVAFFASASWKLVRHARRYDAVLLGDFALATVAIVAKLASFGRLRTVVQLHGNDLYFMRKRGPVALLYRALCRLVVATGALDATIANSHAIREEASRHRLPVPAVVPLGTVAPPADVLHEGARAQQVLFAGRLIRYKGLSWFVREVWPHVDPSLELLVAGQVWDESERAALDGQPRVRYLGVMPYAELPAMRAQLLACIMPNVPPTSTEQDEGFGLVALEAPAVGTPTVATRCGGIPDAVVDGVTGFLVAPGDANAFAARLNAIARWSDEERRAFGERARACVLERYAWPRVAHDTLAVLGAHA